jgi:thioesterase domain-containing protein
MLSTIWAKAFNIERVGIRDSIFDLLGRPEVGLRSEVAWRALWKIEKRFGIQLPMSLLFEAPTIEQLAQVLKRTDWAPSWSSLAPIRQSGSRPPFFCVHQVDGSVISYVDLAFHMGPDQPFYALETQGLDRKRALYTTVEDMAAHYLKEIRNIQPVGPYFLGGRCSIGGTVAFEMAQQLLAQGEEIGLLVLFDTTNPPAFEPKDARPESKNSIFRWSRRRIKRNIKIFKRRVAGWRNAQVACVHKIEETNVQAVRNYVPKPYSGRILLFMSEERYSKSKYDPVSQFGWGAVADGGLEVFVVPSTYLNCLKNPNALTIANLLAPYFC